MGLYGGICLVSGALAWLSVCYALTKIIPETVMEYFKMLSRNITKIYVLQYVIIIYSYMFIAGEENGLGIISSLVAAGLIFILADLLAQTNISIPKIRVRQLSR